MRHAILIAAAALLAAACAKAPPPVSVVSEPAPAPLLPAECTSPDPAWRDLPDADVTRSSVARLWRVNRNAYRQVVGARRVCRASLAAHFPAAPARAAHSGGE